MGIFEYEDYKAFVNSYLRSLPKKGYGQMRKIANALKIHTTLVSQILRGSKDLSPEQAVGLAEYFGFTHLEKEYLLILVQRSRAGSEKLRAVYSKQLANLRAQSMEVKNRIPKTKKLDENSRAQFYSQWYFSAVRLMTTIPSFQTPEKIASELKLPLGLVRSVLGFLVEVGLCAQDGSRFKTSELRTHIERSSLLVGRHHTNWRLKAIANMDDLRSDELGYTFAVTLSEADAQWIHQRLLDFIEVASKRLQDSPAEELRCLNIDWFKVNKK